MITKNPPVYVVLACGAVSSFVGQLVTYPIALIRTRRQGQIVPLPSMDQSKAHPLLPATQMLKDIWHREGITGFYPRYGTKHAESHSSRLHLVSRLRKRAQDDLLIDRKDRRQLYLVYSRISQCARMSFNRPCMHF